MLPNEFPLLGILMRFAFLLPQFSFLPCLVVEKMQESMELEFSRLHYVI